MQLVDDRLIVSASDLNGFVACRHLTRLDHARARGELADEPERSESADLVARKGDEHEAAYLASLKAAGREVVEIPEAHGLDEVEAAAEQTRAAMEGGADVIYQATFLTERFRGYADFLFRVENPRPNLGEWSYEVADTKLARRTKPYFILQLCFYSELLQAVQGGEPPERIHVILGTREQHSFRLAEFSAYYRRVRDRLLADLEAGPDTYPDPVEHCAICRWRTRCDGQREADDHLSRVARMRRDQIERLAAAGITSLTELGRADPTTTVARIPAPTLEGLHQQARLQLHYTETGEHVHELLDPEPKRGLALLPPPAEGDVFFDMEGDPFYENGLEYLFGVHFKDDGEWRFQPFWGHDRAGEKRAFEQFIDFVVERRAQHPDMHVYHYANYERAALKRLMGTHATREAEVDQLLREHVLVDLYQVVRQSLRVSQPSYSIKKLEAFYRDAERNTDVTEAADSIVVYEKWIETQDPKLLDGLAAYNADDCLSTLQLRDWLLERKAEAEERFGPIEWAAPDGEAADRTEATADGREEIEALKARLLEGVPDDRAEASGEERARWLCAQLLDYHWREAKPSWWAYFERLGMSVQELVDDAEAIGELEPDGEATPPQAPSRSWIHPLRFPSQEHNLRAGDGVDDPATGQGAGKIVEIDEQHGRLFLSRGPKLANVPLPQAIIGGQPYRTGSQRAALRRLGEAVAREGLAEPGSQPPAATRGTYRALRGVLLREHPRVAGTELGQVLQSGEFDLDQAKRIVSNLDDSHLFIQGPPGAGKTYSGARLIVHLMKEKGARVGIASTSHKAIHTLLDAVEQAAVEQGFEFRGLKKSSGDENSTFTGRFIASESSASVFPPSHEVQLVAGTAWLFTREEMDSTLDYLFIDEAGQVALADALAMGTTARNLVLLGDPQQLSQVAQAAHPQGTSDSVLEHLLGDDETIPADRGLFLDKTWRMHPAVCEFISEVMYEGRLTAAPGRERQGLLCENWPTAGIRYLPVAHTGNTRSSTEEAQRVAEAVGSILGGEWTNADGRQATLNPSDLMVVAPYNAHVRCLTEHLPAGIRIGTVDKFQGQEAAIAFFSMATSTGEDIPRNIKFLFSRNRLNVAISRARCLAILVASPALLEAPCRNIDEMKLINALCRFVEVAEPADRG